MRTSASASSRWPLPALSASQTSCNSLAISGIRSPFVGSIVARREQSPRSSCPARGGSRSGHRLRSWSGRCGGVASQRCLHLLQVAGAGGRRGTAGGYGRGQQPQVGNVLGVLGAPPLPGAAGLGAHQRVRPLRSVWWRMSSPRRSMTPWRWRRNSLRNGSRTVVAAGSSQNACRRRQWGQLHGILAVITQSAGSSGGCALRVSRLDAACRHRAANPAGAAAPPAMPQTSAVSAKAFGSARCGVAAAGRSTSSRAAASASATSPKRQVTNSRERMARGAQRSGLAAPGRRLGGCSGGHRRRERGAGGPRRGLQREAPWRLPVSRRLGAPAEAP